MNENNENKYFIENANGIVVIHIRFWMDESNRHSSLDYHLHTITFYDDTNEYAGIFCLDTKDVFIQEAKKDISSLKMAIDLLSRDIAISFIDRAKSITRQGHGELSDDQMLALIFDRAGDEMWNKFNEMKQKTYVQSMRNIFSSKLIHDIQIKKEEAPIYDKPDFVHDSAEIRVSEERLIMNEAN